jgi:ribonuclease P protein component
MVAVPSALDGLKRRADFLRIASAGMKWGTAVLVVQACKAGVAAKGAMPGDVATADERPRESARGASIRVGYTASRKVGGAVARNRARRRMRAIAREILPFEAKPGFDYVLIARPQTVECEFARLRADLRQALKRLKLARAASDAAA